jgi:predicted metal-dependent HD superfamily phosphohydrolase
MSDAMQKRFIDLCLRVAPGSSAEGGSFAYHLLCACYAYPRREYHTLRHVSDCLTLFDEFRESAADPDAIEFSLFVHDAIYDAARKDNEARSAVLGAMLLDQLGAQDALVTRVGALVTATSHTRSGLAGDEALIVDLDLAVLGADPGRYDEYAVGIRKEYAHADASAYRVGRCAFLRSMLARERLFSLDAVRGRFEAQARLNMAVELESLVPPSLPDR